MKKLQSAYLTYFDVFFEKLEYAVFLDEKLTYLTALKYVPNAFED